MRSTAGPAGDLRAGRQGGRAGGAAGAASAEALGRYGGGGSRTTTPVPPWGTGARGGGVGARRLGEVGRTPGPVRLTGREALVSQEALERRPDDGVGRLRQGEIHVIMLVLDRLGGRDRSPGRLERSLERVRLERASRVFATMQDEKWAQVGSPP